jgi:uncharacterized protein YhfF
MKGRGRVVRMIWALLRSTEYDGLVRFGRCLRRGALAQLVERFVRNEKVRGSTPLGSTLQSSSTTVERVTSPTDSALRSFWERARVVAPSLPAEWSDAWAFGATPEHADELLELVLSGTKTGTASSLWDHEATGEPVPRAGELSVILDGAGRPRAVLETTDVVIVPFDQVGEDHARSEGEGDRTLRAWREIHERYWRDHSENPRGFEPTMPVVCERFRLLHAEPAGRAS